MKGLRQLRNSMQGNPLLSRTVLLMCPMRPAVHVKSGGAKCPVTRKRRLNSATEVGKLLPCESAKLKIVRYRSYSAIKLVLVPSTVVPTVPTLLLSVYFFSRSNNQRTLTEKGGFLFPAPRLDIRNIK